jgi:hypothetical protein
MPKEFDGSLDGLAELVRVDNEGIADARRRVVDLVRGEDDMEKFVDTFERLTASRGENKPPATPSLDLVAEKAGINRSICVGAITRVLHQWHFDTAKLMVAAVCLKNAPAVAETMVNAAKDEEHGHRDRRLFMEAARIIDPRGSPMQQVNVNAPTTNSTVNARKAVVVMGKELPSFEDGTKKMAAALRQIPQTFQE